MTSRTAPPDPRDPIRHRLQRLRSDVESLVAVNRHQELLQALVLEILDYVERLRERPNTRAQQAQWWGAAIAYREVLASPVLESSQARSAYRQIVDAPWPEVARVARSLLHPGERRAQNRPGRQEASCDDP